MSNEATPLQVPCCYQGGKQRIADQITTRILALDQARRPETRFFDLCCGSGAVTLELINQGIHPKQITMLDRSSWGTFWHEIGTGCFDLSRFSSYIEAIPNDKKQVKNHVTELSKKPIGEEEAYLYPILQSCSFGGKQVWVDDSEWVNAFFRDYWEPTPTSVRRSPANPMQPSPAALYKRIAAIVERCRGVTCIQRDIMDFVEEPISSSAIVYVDPPYKGTTRYGFTFDLERFLERYLAVNSAPLFVSEGYPLSDDAEQLQLKGAKGGISGNKKKPQEEWLSRFNVVKAT